MHLTARSVQRLIRGHQHLFAQHQRAVRDSLEASGKVAIRHVQRHPRFTPRSGRLQRATKSRVVRTAGGKLLKLTNNRKHAAAIDKGARPHDIVPRRRKFLRFRGRSGKWVFARRVKHPGNKPYQFLHGAHRAAYRFAGQDLRHRLTRIASRF